MKRHTLLLSLAAALVLLLVSAWQVLGRSSLWDFLTGEGPLVTSRTVQASRCQIPFGRGKSFSVRFLDGTREGQIRSIELDYPNEILLAIGEAEADATASILAAK